MADSGGGTGGGGGGGGGGTEPPGGGTQPPGGGGGGYHQPTPEEIRAQKRMLLAERADAVGPDSQTLVFDAQARSLAGIAPGSATAPARAVAFGSTVLRRSSSEEASLVAAMLLSLIAARSFAQLQTLTHADSRYHGR